MDSNCKSAQEEAMNDVQASKPVLKLDDLDQHQMNAEVHQIMPPHKEEFDAASFAHLRLSSQNFDVLHETSRKSVT